MSAIVLMNVPGFVVGLVFFAVAGRAGLWGDRRSVRRRERGRRPAPAVGVRGLDALDAMLREAERPVADRTSPPLGEGSGSHRGDQGAELRSETEDGPERAAGDHGRAAKAGTDEASDAGEAGGGAPSGGETVYEESGDVVVAGRRAS